METERVENERNITAVDLFAGCGGMSLGFEKAGVNVVAVRRPNGTMWGPFTATRVDDYTLSVAATIDFAPVFDGSIEPPHVMFGGVERFAYPVLLTSIKPNGMASTDMQAVGYDARVYADDDNSPP